MKKLNRKKFVTDEGFCLAMAFNEASEVMKEVKKLQVASEGKLITITSHYYYPEMEAAFYDIQTNIKDPESNRSLKLSVTSDGMTILSDGDKNLSSTHKDEKSKKPNNGANEIATLKALAQRQGILPTVK